MENKMQEKETTVGQVKAWVYNAFPVARERQVEETDSLLDSGIIDSMGTLEVVDFLETEFEIEVLDDEMVADHFDSIASIAEFIRHKQGDLDNVSGE